jgi:hypothetical protein
MGVWCALMLVMLVALAARSAAAGSLAADAPALALALGGYVPALLDVVRSSGRSRLSGGRRPLPLLMPPDHLVRRFSGLRAETLL